MTLEQYTPAWRWIVVEPIIEEKTKGGLYLPEGAQALEYQPTPKARVLKVGAQAELVKEGDVIFAENVMYAKQLDLEGYKQGTVYSIQEQLIVGFYRPE